VGIIGARAAPVHHPLRFFWAHAVLFDAGMIFKNSQLEKKIYIYICKSASMYEDVYVMNSREKKKTTKNSIYCKQKLLNHSRIKKFVARFLEDRWWWKGRFVSKSDDGWRNSASLLVIIKNETRFFDIWITLFFEAIFSQVFTWNKSTASWYLRVWIFSQALNRFRLKWSDRWQEQAKVDLYILRT
jgi:hypothetical protein